MFKCLQFVMFSVTDHDAYTRPLLMLCTIMELVNTDWGNGLVLLGNEPLSQPVFCNTVKHV